MTITDILEQVKTLSPQERDELVHQLLAMRDNTPVQAAKLKTGAEIVAMLEEMGPIDLIYPDIEDPVEWVKQIRRDQAQKRDLDWGNGE
jgi:hypothetical protein